ncbi:GGDEF domain-containing protein [Pelomonas sp. KK5]|uniref:GGDEF domain-containing protein n=1 Tax=Pelomonas sp. KK5 TaxID=1855730 RepID=UPI0009F87D3B|nr:GGDEF domain-containing protein [Pelomonas sp. KK5]
MKRSSRTPRPPKPTTATKTGVSTAERDELRRQGAKAAARGEHSISNPMGAHANMPDSTGESQDTWQFRKEAWQHGHDSQSQSKAIDGRRIGPGTQAGSVNAATDRPTSPASDDLAMLVDETRRARETLSALQEDIAWARSDEGLRTLAAMVQENRRLQEELWAQHGRAALAADSAHAALQDAVLASETDPLTRLPNRTVLWDRLAHDLALAKRQGTSLAVLFLDLDGLKQVNDRFGHDIGDLLLQHVAGILTAGMRASDTVCRTGGDEFVIVASLASGSDLEALTRKIEAAVAEPCTLGGHLISPGVSIGSAVFPDDGDQSEALVHIADAAMYRVKRIRRSSSRPV